MIAKKRRDERRRKKMSTCISWEKVTHDENTWNVKTNVQKDALKLLEWMVVLYEHWEMMWMARENEMADEMKRKSMLSSSFVMWLMFLGEKIACRIEWQLRLQIKRKLERNIFHSFRWVELSDVGRFIIQWGEECLLPALSIQRRKCRDKALEQIYTATGEVRGPFSSHIPADSGRQLDSEGRERGRERRRERETIHRKGCMWECV